jgi:hypothetical protein
VSGGVWGSLTPIYDDDDGGQRPRTTGPRNGLPAPSPYTWRAGEAERQLEVRALVAAVQARVRSLNQ